VREMVAYLGEFAARGEWLMGSRRKARSWIVINCGVLGWTFARMKFVWWKRVRVGG